MKKFLSLLLALTLVLSLVVVPARADAPADGYAITGKATISASASTSVDRGTEITFTLDTSSLGVTKTEDGTTTSLNSETDYRFDYVWSGATAQGNGLSAKVTPMTPGTLNPSCTIKAIVGSTAVAQQVALATEITVNDRLLPGDITTVTFNGRTYSVTNGTVNISLLKGETINNDKNTWSAAATGYVIDNTTNKPTYNPSTGKLTVKTTAATPLSTDITVTSTTASVSAAASLNEVIAGGKTTLTATPSGLSNAATYDWYKKVTGGTDEKIGSGKSFTWTVPATAAGSYSVYCKAKEGTTDAATSADVTISVVADTYQFTVTPASVTLTQIGQTATLAANFVNTSTSPATPVTPTYSFVSANLNIATVTNQTTAAPIVTLRASGSTTVTAKATYKGKDYVQNIPVTGALIEATLSAVQNGTSVNYSYSDLVNAAQAAINKTYSTAYTYETVYSLSGVTQVASTAAYGVSTSNASYNYPAGGSGYLYFKANLSGIGTAKFTATVTTRIANTAVPKTYSVTFNVPVTPSTTTYADQYPEPVAAYGNTYRYYVQVPSGARYYYVAGVNTEPSDWNNGSGNKYYTTTSSTSLYSLTDSNFVGGKCTLYVVTQGTDNRLYCGTISVYQKNYNINYNGVAGETVQFAQSDFNDFMNKVAEARGDASKAKSYPYVTFDYVTFSLPTTAQGTLYYGGTAMSTSNSSGAFNRNTKVTNLDSVTFVPNAKSTAKTITLNFTLYATRYSSSSTSRGTTVSYSGSVVVNLVREDIKYTVSQGDSVRFDESDFLSYLRSTKGYSSNYTIDYVTFDQSAVSAVNEGSLYTYYSGYNYGGSVKTTDKFYYSATASQNALSDVAFLASRYAKTGETVYIPFTIYARYGTTGTGTRQLTGTVAIKIGQTMNFIDVKTTDYFYNSVKWAVGKNITNGTSSTTFSPYKSCTRAEIVTFLWRAAGSPEPTTTRNPFRDVNAVTHSSYYKAILWASQKGITSGTSATAFSPDQVCTRAQIVTFLYRYAGKPSGYYSNPFKDVGATNEASYYNAILWASGKGITTGSSPTTFSPYASCNRAEAVTFLYRYTNGL